MIKRVGRYEVVALLGRGGFGQVFSAFDPIVNSMVAVKVLTTESDERALARFRHEAKVTRQLHHPNIVTVYDFGDQDGVPYLVMELVEGQNLKQIVDERIPLEPWQRVQILTSVATGLAHAHAKGVLHRDVKPANVMLLPDGSVKIMDFGIARVSQANSQRLTSDGAVVMTLAYSAPEQHHGREPDARSDIFAFGLLAYELLAGKYPFPGELAAMLHGLLHAIPAPVSDSWPVCPPSLDAVVARLLEKDPNNRYQTLEDALFDFQPALTEFRRTKARELAGTAEDAYRKNLLNVAQTLNRQVLELDPGFPGAREMREQIQKDQRRQQIRPRIEEAVRLGRENIAAGDLGKAEENLESAVRMDPTDSILVGLLAEARAELDRARSAVNIVAAARKSLREEDFAKAKRMALEALSIAPSDADAQGVLKRADSGIEKRKQKALIDAHLMELRRLTDAGLWTEADDFIQVVLKEFPDSEDVRAAAAKVRAEKVKVERNVRLASALQAGRSELESKAWQKAADRLAEVSREFPESTEAAEMLREARSQLQSEQREATIQNTLQRAADLRQKHAHSEAKRLIEEGLSLFPSEPRLVEELSRLREQIRGEEEAHSIEKAIADLTGAAAALIQRKQWTQAVENLRSRPDLAGEPRIKALLTEAETALNREREAEAAYQQVLRDAAALEREGNLDGATSALDALDKNISSQNECVALRARIVSARAERRNAQCREIVASVNLLLRDGQVDEASRLLASCPAEIRQIPEISALATSIEAAATRERERSKAILEAEGNSAEGKFETAERILDTYQKSFGAHTSIDRVRVSVKSARAARKDAELAELALNRAQEKERKPPSKPVKWLWPSLVGALAAAAIAAVVIFNGPKEPLPPQTSPSAPELTAKGGAPEGAIVSQPIPPTEPKDPPIRESKDKVPPNSKADNSAKAGGVVAVTKVPEPNVEPPPPPSQPPPPPPPQEKAKRLIVPSESYHGPLNGVVTWNGELAAGSTVTIQSGGPSLGRISNFFPATTFGIKIDAPRIAVTERPSAANEWSRLVLRNDGATPVTVIRIEWKAQ